MSLYSGYIEDISFGIPFTLSCPETDPLLPGTLLRAREWIQGNLGQEAEVHESAEVHPSAILEGPLYIGPNVQVGPGAYLRPFTVLGEGCIVGHGAEVKGSICLGGSKLQSQSFTGDSVLGKGARVASGVIIANRRFDQGAVKTGSPSKDSGHNFLGSLLGDYARVGANAICAPGTMVGWHTWIGGLVHAYGVIPPHKLILLKQQWDVRDKPDVELN